MFGVTLEKAPAGLAGVQNHPPTHGTFWTGSQLLQSWVIWDVQNSNIDWSTTKSNTWISFAFSNWRGKKQEKGENLRCLEKYRIIHQIKQLGSWRPLSITTYKWRQASFDVFQCDLCCTLLSLSSIKRNRCTCILPSFNGLQLLPVSFMNSMDLVVETDQPDWFWPFCTLSMPTFCLLTQRCPAQALWPHSFGRQWIWTWSCFRQSFTPDIFSQPLLPFPYAGKSGPWESCLLTPTNHDATLVKPPDMTNKCPAPTKELLLGTGNWSCCKCRPQNSEGFAVPSKSIYSICFQKKRGFTKIQTCKSLTSYQVFTLMTGDDTVSPFFINLPTIRLIRDWKMKIRWPKVHSQC